MTVPQHTAVINGSRNTQTIKSILTNSPFLLLLLSSILCWTPAYAQPPFTPIPATKAEYTYSSANKTLFIRGGLDGTKDVPQFYSLDLSPLEFHSSYLPWKNHFPGGAFSTYGEKMPLAVTQTEGGTLVYFGVGRNMTEFNIVFEHWSPYPIPTCQGTPGATALVRSSHTALVDPNTDLIYIPYAYGGGNEMLVYKNENNTCSGLPMPASSDGKYYAWSDSKNAIYMLGDTVPATGPTMWEFLPTTKGWKKIPVNGSPPTTLQDNSCLVSALGGLRLLLFGGDNSDKATGDMFVFDTGSYSWTKAASSPNVRTEMVCASAAEYFITWGGTDFSPTATPSISMLFYNIVNNKWLKQEADSTFSDALSPASTTATGSGSENSDLPVNDTTASGSNKLAIGGGAAAAVIVIAALVGLFFYRRHNRQSVTTRHPQDLKRGSLAPPGNLGTIVSSETHFDRKAAPHAVVDNKGFDQEQKSNVNAEYLEAAEDGGEEVFVSLHGMQGPQYHPPSLQYDHALQQQQQQTNKLSPFPKKVHRGPQAQHNNAPTDPLEQIALIEAKYEQDREQLRQNQQAALERVRQQWEDDMAARALRSDSNETQP